MIATKTKIAVLKENYRQGQQPQVRHYVCRLGLHGERKRPRLLPLAVR